MKTPVVLDELDFSPINEFGVPFRVRIHPLQGGKRRWQRFIVVSDWWKIIK